MRIVFFSDAHGNQYAVRQLFRELPKEKPDTVIFGGDIFGYYYGQVEILSLLRQSGCICLSGNHDRYFLDLLDGKIDMNYLVERYGSTYRDSIDTVTNADKDFVRSLKSRYDKTVDGMHLSFVHGSLKDTLNGRVYPDTEIKDTNLYNGIDYVFMGHTHHKLRLELANGTVLLNPGSIGQQRDGKGCTYGIFDTKNKEWEIKEIFYDRSSLVSEIERHNESEQIQKRLTEVLYRHNE